jgi:hypothetical protein
MGARTVRANVAFLVLVAAVLVVVGCLSTWATVFGRSFAGTDANAGKSTLVAAIVAAGLILLATSARKRWLSIVAAIPAAIAAAISSYRLADIANFVQGANNAEASWGIWLTTVSAVVLLALCILHALLPIEEPSPDAAPPADEAAPPPEKADAAAEETATAPEEAPRADEAPPPTA